MIDDEWIKNIPNLTNEDLIDELDYCGYDNYYSKIREPIVAEIVKRLNATDKMKCCENCNNFKHKIDHRCNTECKNFSKWELKK